MATRTRTSDTPSDFLFVDSTLHKSVSNEAVKVNAMRRWHRKREQPRKRSPLAPPKGGELQLWTQYTAVNSPVLESLPLPRDSVTSQAALCSEPSPCTSRSPLPCGSGRDATENDDHTSSASPCSTLGAGRRDPFGQYPYRQSRFVDLVVDWYVTTHTLGGGVLAFDMLTHYRSDAASFSAFLAVMSTGLAAAGSQQPELNADEPENHALNLLSSRLANKSVPLRGGTILAIALIANLEERRGNRSTADLHWNGLKEAIEGNGGLQRVVKSRPLLASTFWLEIITSTSRISCLGQLSTGSLPGQARCNRPDYGIIPSLVNCKQEYHQFFTRLLLHIMQDQPGDTNLLNMLGSIPKVFEKEPIKGPERQRQTSMASLLYLAAVRLDHMLHSPEVFNRLAVGVQNHPYCQGGSYTLCGEELLHILFRGAGLSDALACRYACLVSRLMFVARTLSDKEWDTSYGFLSYFLGIPYPPSSWPELLKDWRQIIIEMSCPTVLLSIVKPEPGVDEEPAVWRVSS